MKAFSLSAVFLSLSMVSVSSHARDSHGCYNSTQCGVFSQYTPEEVQAREAARVAKLSKRKDCKAEIQSEWRQFGQQCHLLQWHLLKCGNDMPYTADLGVETLDVSDDLNNCLRPRH